MEIGDRKREKMQSNSPPSVDVNEELMKEILLKLPTKSVLRFKGLSKSWFSAISDPKFARRHFDAAVSPTYKLLNVHSNSEAYCVDIESTLCDDSWHVYNFTVPSRFKPYENYIYVAGSCRGFLLFQIFLQDFVLWNPSTGIQKEIHHDIWTPQLSGMGYDPVDDDIVLVMVTLGNNCNTMVHYFCLRTNCWTSVECGVMYTKNNLQHSHGQFWNGALHWVVKSADNLRNVVIAFDLSEKRLSEIPLPNHLAILPMRSHIYYLKVMGEYLNLCLVVVRNQTLQIEIWSMKEYTEEKVWTKTFGFFPSSRILCDFIFPICFTENGEILAFYGNKLVKIDDKGKLRYEEQCSRTLHFQKCAMYRESFLPLPCDSEEEKLSKDENED